VDAETGEKTRPQHFVSDVDRMAIAKKLVQAVKQQHLENAAFTERPRPFEWMNQLSLK
jgi:hypothetical protein